MQEKYWRAELMFRLWEHRRKQGIVEPSNVPHALQVLYKHWDEADPFCKVDERIQEIRRAVILGEYK